MYVPLQRNIVRAIELLENMEKGRVKEKSFLDF